LTIAVRGQRRDNLARRPSVMPETDPDELIVHVQLNKEASSVVPQADAADFARLTRGKLEEVANTARNAATVIVKRLREFEVKPERVGLEFGISVGAEAGIPFVTKGTLESEFKISIEWAIK
jgi:hypothetical protein